MLTDTYPDQEDYRHLLMFDSCNNEVYEIGKFYSYPRGMKEKDKIWNISGMRCDLHPKWGHDGYIYFDSVHEGMRGLYRVDVSELLKGNL